MGVERYSMKADNIEKIISDIDCLPYRAILFDGTWGIGKSYAVNEALTENSNVCKISMFGLKDPKQIYHEALFQLALKNNIGGKIGEIANNVLDGLSKIWDKVGQAKEVVQSIANERELFLLLSKEFSSVHVIVIDDLERMSDDIRLEELFGIIEELKQCNYVKVIVIANTNEIQPDKKVVFDKYNEKVLERIYHITERAEKVEWSKMNIHVEFVEKFLNIHKVENLRTLEKAQRFFEDVKLFCKSDMSEQFLEELRLICFAIVVESIDNLYYKEANSNNTDSVEKMVSTIGNTLQHRIGRYLYEIKCSGNLVEMLLEYYEEGVLNVDQLDAEYKLFLNSGGKSNYYKSDEEIRRVLPTLREEMIEAKNLAELNQFADSYVVWSDILEENNESVLSEYRKILNKMLKEIVLSGKEEILTYSYDLFHILSEKIKRIYQEENKEMMKFSIETYVKYLKNTTRGKKAYEYSYKLRNKLDSSYYHDVIMTNGDDLYNRISFPVDDVDEDRYHTCYNIMYVLYHLDAEKFLQYCEELKEDCDNMSRHRIDVLIEEIVKK